MNIIKNYVITERNKDKFNEVVKQINPADDYYKMNGDHKKIYENTESNGYSMKVKYTKKYCYRTIREFNNRRWEDFTITTKLKNGYTSISATDKVFEYLRECDIDLDDYREFDHYSKQELNDIISCVKVFFQCEYDFRDESYYSFDSDDFSDSEEEREWKFNAGWFD
jgi:hypothetical protein